MENLEGDNVAIDIVLRRLIEAKDLKQTDIARAIGMAQSTFHDWTYGRIPRDLKTVKKLANYFGVSFEYMVFGIKQDQDELKNRVDKLELENAMIKLETQSQLNLFENQAQAKIRIDKLKQTYYEKFGERI